MKPTEKSHYWTEKIEEEEQKALTASYLIYKEEDTGIIYAKNGDTGKIDFYGTDAASVIQSVLNSCSDYGVLKLVGDFTITSGILVTKNIYIDAYGAKFTAGAETTAARMIQPDSGKMLYLAGLRADLMGIWGVFTGAEITRLNTTLILKDIEFTNVYNYGINQTGEGGTVILENVKGYAVSGGSSNELLLTEKQKEVILRNTKLYGNKPHYITAEKIHIDNSCEFNTVGYTSHYCCPTFGKRITIKDSVFDSTYPRISVYGDVHLDTPEASVELAVLENLTLKETEARARLEIRPYDETYGIEQLIIKNIRQDYTPINIYPWVSGVKSWIKQLIVENVRLNTYSAAPWILDINTVDISQDTIKKVYMPETAITNCSYLRLDAQDADINVNLKIEDIYSAPTLSYILNISDDGTGRAINGEIDLRGLQLRPIRNISGTAILNATIKQVNKGTATFSGDGVTTQFTIAHGLVSTPSKVQVTPMSSDAAGDFYVTADATNIYINYITAPASGTDNVKLSWYAEV